MSINGSWSINGLLQMMILSCLAFFQYATKQMREKLQIYDELDDLQERSGGVNAVILIALGTLIWLIS